MGYRDESEALRARIGVLERALEESERDNVQKAPEASELSAASPLERKITRYSLTVNGKLSKDGVDSIRQLLWAKVGAAGAQAGFAPDNEPPGDALLVHSRGRYVFRVVESAGKTHLSVDYRRWSAGQLFMAILGVAATMVLSMLAAGVHEDWIQMVAGIYAMATVLLGPIVIFGGRGPSRSRSVALLQEMAGLAQQHLLTDPLQARVGTSQEAEALEVDAAHRTLEKPTRAN